MMSSAGPQLPAGRKVRTVTQGSGLANVLEALDRHGSQVRPRGGYYTAQCPAHDDRTGSLSISQGEKGAVMNCFANCPTEDIRSALNLPWKAIFDNDGQDGTYTAPDLWMPCQMPDKKTQAPGCSGRKIAEYRYTDEHGIFLFATCRCSRKGDGCQGFAQWHPDDSSKSGKRWNLEGVKRVIYRLPQVLKAVAERRRVWFVEGEKDAELLESLGEVATTSPMGAKSWLREYARFFKGAVEVIIVADCDEPGLIHAQRVFEDVGVFAEKVRVVCSPVDKKGADTTDHISYGLSLDDFEVVPFEKAEGRPRMVIQVEERHTEKPVLFPGFSPESVQQQLVGSMLKYGTSYQINPGDIRNDKQLLITVTAIAAISGRGSVITPETVAAEIQQRGQGAYAKVLPYLFELEKKAYDNTDHPSRAARALRERSIRYGIVYSLRAVAEAAMNERREIPEVLEYLATLTVGHSDELAALSHQYGEPTGDVFTGDVVEEVAREEGFTTRTTGNVRRLRPEQPAQDQRQTATRRG